MDATKKQLPSQNKVSIALDVWTLKNKLAIKSVITYSMDQNWTFPEVQLALDEVYPLFFSNFES
jgi:hypothetical protein